jgi:predicted DNA-binding protein (UPF0251 family)
VPQIIETFKIFIRRVTRCLVPVPLFDPTTFGKKYNETQEVEIEINELDLIVLTQSCDIKTRDFASLYSVPQSHKVWQFYTKIRAQCLAPLQMYLTGLGVAIRILLKY